MGVMKLSKLYIEVSNGFLLGDLRPRGMLDGML